MKNFYLSLAISLLVSTSSSAQGPIGLNQRTSGKPMLFARVASKTAVDSNLLLQTFKAAIQDTLTIRFNDHYTFTGVLMEKVQHSSELLSINLRSLDVPGALLTLSLLTPTDSNQRITGRIIHPRGGDVLQLVREKKHYYLVKQAQKFFVTE